VFIKGTKTRSSQGILTLRNNIIGEERGTKFVFGTVFATLCSMCLRTFTSFH
jgi:hypothetical protein